MNERVEFFRRGIGNNLWQEHYPIMKLLNGSIVEVNEGHLVYEFKVTENLLNVNGILHGGMMATMMDELMGAATWTMNRANAYATINLNVDFITAVRADEIIRGEGNVIKAGNTVMHTDAKLFNASGKLVAKATSNLVIMKPKEEKK